MPVSLAFQKTGQGPALIILHGLLGSADNWRTHALRLSESFTVYAVDLRNHGRSPHADPHTNGEMARDVLALMDAEGLSETLLLGHSMGGKTAMQVAVWEPARVSRLIVADISPRAYAPRHATELDAIQRLDLAALSSRKEADEQMAQWIPDFGVRQFLLKSLYRTDDGAFAWRFNVPTLIRDYNYILEGISGPAAYEGPTLFIRGEKSNYITERDLPEIARWFPNHRMETIPGAGHWVHAEAPEPFIQSVAGFLGAQLPPREA